MATCLVSENSGLAGRGSHAAGYSAMGNLQWLSSHKQGNSLWTHLNHEDHVKGIKKSRDYLLDVWFSQDGVVLGYDEQR